MQRASASIGIFSLLLLSLGTLMGNGIMSYEEYASSARPELYSFSITHGNQHLYYFGANHSVDPKNRQFPLLKDFWQEFIRITEGKNCVALVEGNLQPLQNTSEDACLNGAEGGLVTFLASEHSISVECPEPSRRSRIAELLQEFTQEEILYTFGAQGALHANRARPYRKNFSLEEYIESHLLQYNDYFSIPLTLENFRCIHSSLFKHPLDITDEHFFYMITNPAKTDTRINLVCRRNSIFRDTYVVNYVLRLLAQGKNIFIAFGSTHAIMQEKALCATSCSQPLRQP